MAKKGLVILYWMPRILGGGLCIGLFLLALDSLSINTGFWGGVLAFLLHLLPALIAFIVLFIACCRERTGGLCFLGLAAAAYVLFNKDSTLLIGLLIALPGMITGTLFLIDWAVRSQNDQSLNKWF